MAIDFAFDDIQVQLQQAAQRLFAERSSREIVRAVEAEPAGYRSELWAELAELGWVGLTLASEYGGSDGRFQDLYPLYEEMGRYLVASPHLDTVAVSADLIARVGSPEQKRTFLPAIASGECLLSVATVEPSGSFDPAGIETTAVAHGDGYVLDGTKLLVSFAPSANYFLVTARTAPGHGSEGVSVLIVPSDADGISVVPLENIAGGPLSAVIFEGVRVEASSVLGQAGAGWHDFEQSTTKAAVLQTATIVGAARAVLEMTSQYAKDRVQFGHAIGSYQAVQYMVSDILIGLHNAEMLAKQATYRIDAGLPFEKQAAMAVAYGKSAAAHLHRQAHEVHAGVGFMQIHDLQLYSRRSKFWENNLGDARHYFERVARATGL